MKDLRVPSWLHPLCRSENGDIPLGPIPGVYATHPGQQEDTLNEQTVRSGFSTPVIVGGSTEGFSAHSSLYDSISSNKLLPHLSNLVKDVLKQQDKDHDKLAPHAFKLPNRVTLTDQKREAWVTDLANPAVPIAKLSKGVPHGYRGEKLLEMLITRKVPIDRAAWYVQVVGASEIHNQKSRASTSSAPGFAQEWTTVLCDGLTKTLSEIPLPSTNVVLRPGMSIKSKAKSVLSDVDMRKKWLARLAYIEALSIIMYQQGLLSCSHLYTFIVEQLGSAHLGLLGFIHNFAEPYIYEAADQTGFLTRVVHACCEQLAALETLVAPKDYLVASLQKTIRAVLAMNSAALISSSTWLAHQDILVEALKAAEDDGFADTIASIIARNRWLVLQQENDGIDLTLSNDYKSITFLDTLPSSYAVDDACRQFFSIGNAPLRHQIFLLLDWTVSSTRSGPHRKYVASAFCVTAQSRIKSHGLGLQSVLVDWLDEANKKRDHINVSDLVSLFAELQEATLYSYSAHLQWAISRGGTRLRQERDTCFHARLLWELPIYSSSDSAMTQRRIVMGITAEEVLQSGKSLSQTRTALLAALPFLTSSGSPTDDSRCTDALRAVQGISSADERYRLTHDWLNPAIEAKGVVNITLQEAGLVASVYIQLGDYRSLVKFVLLVLRCRASIFIIRLAVDLTVTLRHIWSPMQQLHKLEDALHFASNTLAEDQRSTKPAQVAYQKLFGSISNQQVDIIDSTKEARALTLPELATLSNSSTDEEIAQVVSYVLSRSSTSSVWPACLANVDESNISAICSLLREVDSHMHDSLQATALSGLEAASPSPSLEDLLLSLVDAGVLSLQILIRYYVLPNIRRASTTASFISQLFGIPSDLAIRSSSSAEPRGGLRLQLQELFFDSDGMELLCDTIAELCNSHEAGNRQSYKQVAQAICASSQAQAVFDRHSRLLTKRCALKGGAALADQFGDFAVPNIGAPWCFNRLRLSMMGQLECLCRATLSLEESVTELQAILKDWLSLGGVELVVQDLVKSCSSTEVNLLYQALIANLLEAFTAFSDTDRAEQQMLDDYMRIERFATAMSTSDWSSSHFTTEQYEALLNVWNSCAAYVLDCFSSSASDSDCILLPVILGSLRILLRSSPTIKDGSDITMHIVNVLYRLLQHGYEDQLSVQVANVDNIEDLLVQLLTTIDPTLANSPALLLPPKVAERIRRRVLAFYHTTPDLFNIDTAKAGLKSKKVQEIDPWHLLNLPNQLLVSAQDIVPWASNAGAVNMSLFQVKALEAPCRAAPLIEVADSSDGEPQSLFASEQATERTSVWHHLQDMSSTGANNPAREVDIAVSKDVIAVSDGEDEDIPTATTRPVSKSKKRKEPSTSDIEVLIPKVDVPAPKKVKSRK